MIMKRFKFIRENTKGIRREISMSKIRNIRLIRKNWIQNGIRVLEIGSKPHSKEEDFSRHFLFFFEIMKLIRRKKLLKKKKNNVRMIKFIII